MVMQEVLFDHIKLPALKYILDLKKCVCLWKNSGYAPANTLKSLIILIILFAKIFCITRTLCRKIDISKTRRRHPRDLEIYDKDASTPDAQYFNLHNHSKEHMGFAAFLFIYCNTERRKNTEQKPLFQIGTLRPSGINEHITFY